MGSRRIVKNALFCFGCDTEIESKHRHDFVRCPCGAIFVDGGLAYVRAGWTPEVEWEDRSVFEDVE